MRESSMERELKETSSTYSVGGSSMTVEWTKVGELDVVTRDQFERGIAMAESRGAKRGVTMVRKSMKNDPAFRRAMR
jgi:hypothetical protein